MLKDTSAVTSHAWIRTHILTTPELESDRRDCSATTLHKYQLVRDLTKNQHANPPPPPPHTHNVKSQLKKLSPNQVQLGQQRMGEKDDFSVRFISVIFDSVKMCKQF